MLQAGSTLRGTRAPTPGRSRLPSGQLRQPGRAYADDPRPTVAEALAAPLDFARDHPDLPCTRPGVDPEWWFPAGTCSRDPDVLDSHRRRVQAAKALCRACSVRVACAAYATVHHLQGIWGATTEDERRAIRQRRTA